MFVFPSKNNLTKFSSSSITSFLVCRLAKHAHAATYWSGVAPATLIPHTSLKFDDLRHFLWNFRSSMMYKISYTELGVKTKKIKSVE